MQTSQLYEQCKKQFLTNIDKLQAFYGNGQVKSQGKYNVIISDVQSFSKLVNHTKLLIKHISVQMCSLNTKKSKAINEELKPFKDRFRYFQKKLQIIKSQNQQTTGQFAQNTNMTVKQLQDNDKLSQSKKLLYEMEDISGSVSQNLRSQTQKMEKSKATLFDTGAYISKANSLIDKMIARQRRKQAVTCMTLTAAIFIIGGLKYCCY